jgi:PAS domain S-box-containing protein
MLDRENPKAGQNIYNSRILQLYTDHLQDHHPSVGVQEILDYAGIAWHELEDPNQWFNQRHIDRFHEILEEKLGYKDISREVGRRAALSRVASPFMQYILGFMNIASAYSQVEKIASSFTRAHTFSCKKTGRDSVTVTVQLREGMVDRPFQCENRLGMLESLPKVFTNKYAHVEHRVCLHHGDDRCEYLITWDRPRSRLLKQLRNTVVTAGAIGCGVLFFMLPLTFWLFAALIATLCSLVFSLLTIHREKQEMSETVEKQGDSAQELIDEVNKHYHDAMLVQEIGKKTATQLNMYELIITVINAMEKHLDYDFGMLFLCDKGRIRLIYAGGYGFDGGIEYSLQKTKLYLEDQQSQQLFLWTFQNQVPVIVSSRSEMDRSFVEEDLNFASRLDAKSVICVPIVYESDSLGVLSVWNKSQGRTMKESDRVLLMAVASQTASCIKNALYFQKLCESEEKYRSLVESSRDGICIVQDGVLKFINEQAIQIIGYAKEEVMGTHFEEFIHPTETERVREKYLRLMSGKEENQQYESVLIMKDGRTLDVEMNATTTNYDGRRATLVFVRDITERKLLESKLRQVQKMEAVGTLAGGIAHDFNNILTAIIGYLNLALRKCERGTVLDSHLNEVLKASYRAGDLVKQILAFSRQGDRERKPIQISHLVRESLKLLRSSLPSTIDIQSRIVEKPGIILGEPTQIHQILMNLCTNAAHAMSDEGGVLEVTVQNVYLDTDFCQRHLDIGEGPYVQISVRDTGHGISPEIIERIFEPYFTTKEKGRGTGLGLATVHGIVKSYRGTIEVESSPGRGSVFEVYLPIIEDEETGDETDAEPLPRGTERVLLVDDEEQIVRVETLLLQDLGYDVVAFTSSVDALEYLHSKPRSVDLVITDMTMPNMTGDKLSQKLLSIRRDIPVILCTGFSEKMNRERAKSLGIQGFLMKPLVPRDVARLIRRVLKEVKIL